MNLSKDKVKAEMLTSETGNLITEGSNTTFLKTPLNNVLLKAVLADDGQGVTQPLFFFPRQLLVYLKADTGLSATPTTSNHTDTDIR